MTPGSNSRIMERRGVEAVVRALNDAGARYLIAGGLAVVAHGVVRFTADVDIVLDLQEENLRRAIPALASLGYRPRAPVEFGEFADAGARSRWAVEKGMMVFSVFSPAASATEVDLFLGPPFDFDEVFRRRATFEVAPGLSAPFVGLSDLVEMKRRAGRKQDLSDAEQLEWRSRGPECGGEGG
jgi:hypothetical protein